MGEKDPADLPLVDFAEEHTREFRHWCVDKGGDLSAETPNEWNRQAECQLPSGERITVYPTGSGFGESHTRSGASPDPSTEPNVEYRITVTGEDYNKTTYFSDVDPDNLILDPDMEDMKDVVSGLPSMGIGFETAMTERDQDIAIRSDDSFYIWKED